MKKLLVILLLAFFTVGITSCAEDFTETDPIVPEISNTLDGPNDEKSMTERKKRTRARAKATTGKG